LCFKFERGNDANETKIGKKLKNADNAVGIETDRLDFKFW
jgi:hypothetical protein